MEEWLSAGEVFCDLAENVGEDKAKQILLARFDAGLLVAKITRFVSETEANFLDADLNAHNAARRARWQPEYGPYKDYDFPEPAYSARDNLILDKDHLPRWLTWHHWKAPPDIWSALLHSHSFRADWRAGEFATRYYHRLSQAEDDGGDFTDTLAAGVMFRADLVAIIPERRMPRPSSRQEVGSNPGGRPAQRHGDAIARVTLDLGRLSSQELRRHTSASIAEDLLSAYRAIGESPPSRRSADLYAAGILRVLRAQET